MPSVGPRTCTNRILRDYLLAALRCSAHPMTTTELRQAAPPVAVPGSARPLPPPQETIYRLLRSLHSEGAIRAAETANRRRAWTVTDSHIAQREIATLEALLHAPSAPVTHHPTDYDSCRRHR